jgi:electron transport complex protein RnfC
MTMRLFRFKGGIHPEAQKRTDGLAVRPLPLPRRLYVPLQQHIGAPAEPVVYAGQPVRKGELLAKAASGTISAPVHAPTSGQVLAIDAFTAPHASGLTARTVILQPDGEERWCDTVVPLDPFKLAPEVVAARVGEAGIVGMGGAAFPAAVKLNLGQSRRIETLIINGAECEPYLTADDRLMRERAAEVVDGIRLMLHALGARRAIVAVEDNKPQARIALREATRLIAQISVAAVPTRYPMGSEKQMIQVLTGLEVPAGKLSADIGVMVHNVATAYAVQQAIRHGRPLVTRIVTVSGGAVARPANLEVPIGTLVDDLIAHCGGYTQPPARLLLGGPMMGTALPHGRVPIVKGSNGVLALAADEVNDQPAGQCIRCARCVGVCPLGLVPMEMAAHARRGDVEAAARLGLHDCISCGSCAYVCPAAIPLTQYFSYAKGELAARGSAKRKADHTKALATARQARAERDLREKKEAAARRKAEKARQQAAAESGE